MSTALKYSQGSTNQQHNVHFPRQLQKYYEILKENNRCSIFDENFDEDGDYDADNKNNSAEQLLTINKTAESAKLQQLLLEDDGNVIRVSSGRGRGGKNIFFKPGDLKGVSNDPSDHNLDVVRAIRQIAPLGYGNEITENAVKQHQMKNKLEDRSSIIIERKSLPSSSSCSRNTSNYSSPGASKSLSIASTSSSVSANDSEIAPIIINKPSICELLKVAREECKKLHKKRWQNGVDEETHLKIVEILQQDEEEEFQIQNMTKPKVSKTTIKNDGCKSRKNVDINSFHEFPHL